MDRTLRSLCLALLLAASAAAEERLAVLEFFGRPGGANCEAAGPTMISLQEDMAGVAVLLEYSYDLYTNGRVERWWAAHQGGGSVSLPLVMVGSGYQVSSGAVDYLRVYRQMLEAELARPPAAVITAYSRQRGGALRVYVRASNQGAVPLLPEHDAAFWVVVWEDAAIGVSNTWVRATRASPLATALDPGEVATAVVDTSNIVGVDWSRVRSLVLLEHRPDGGAVYDLLQAAVALPAALVAVPDTVALSLSQPSADVALSGPHVLSWTASTDAQWLQVTPTGGTVPGEVTITLLPEVAPSGHQSATVEIQANGDGLALAASVSVTAEVATGQQPRRPRGRVEPAPSP